MFWGLSKADLGVDDDDDGDYASMKMMLMVMKMMMMVILIWMQWMMIQKKGRGRYILYNVVVLQQHTSFY